MQRETATPVGFPVCKRHKDCWLKKDSGMKIAGCLLLFGTCLPQQTSVPLAAGGDLCKRLH